MNFSHTSTDINANPMGTDGFEFVEYTAADPMLLGSLFEKLGFSAVAKHRSKDVVLYRQGDINFIVNRETGSRGQRFARDHGPSACAVAFRVRDAAAAHERALQLGAADVPGSIGPMELNIPGIEGIGGSTIYLVDRYKNPTIYDIDFVPIQGADPHPFGVGLVSIDHLTNNVFRGRMDLWTDYYERIFNMREIRYFDIEGRLTGLKSRALTSACRKIRIPINESSDDKSQIEEYLLLYRGEGIQHIALATDDIFVTVKCLREKGVKFASPPPDAYYEALVDRLPGHGEDLAALKSNGVLLDGSVDGGRRLLLQIFTETVIGPIFFEIIQRKGDEGFGEGNFKALFESMERDQIRRGVLADKAMR